MNGLSPVNRCLFLMTEPSIFFRVDADFKQRIIDQLTDNESGKLRHGDMADLGRRLFTQWLEEQEKKET